MTALHFVEALCDRLDHRSREFGEEMRLPPKASVLRARIERCARRSVLVLGDVIARGVDRLHDGHESSQAWRETGHSAGHLKQA